MKGNMLCWEIFKDHTMKNIWKINVWYTVVHRISTTASDTNAIFSAQVKLFKISKMTIKHEGKYAVLGNFQRPHCQNLWKINVWYSVVHPISTMAPDTIAIFSAQIELFESYKMRIKHTGKYAVLGNFQRPHYEKSMENQCLVYSGP